MANSKISALTSATTPLAGTETLPIVQSGATVKVAVSDLTAGRAVATGNLTTTGTATISSNAAIGTTSPNVNANRNTLTLQGAWGGEIDITVGATTHARFGTDNFSSGYSCRVESQDSIILKTGTSSNVVVETGNLVIGTSGKGIDFSATPGTGTSELLADYEEGTWTPSLGGNTTYNGQTGTYTKVGRLVFVRGILLINAIGTGSTTQISGLPFANASGQVCAISVGSFFASATAVTSFFASVSNGGSVINVNSLVIAGTTEGSSAIFANNTQFQFSGCYSV